MAAYLIVDLEVKDAKGFEACVWRIADFCGKSAIRHRQVSAADDNHGDCFVESVLDERLGTRLADEIPT